MKVKFIKNREVEESNVPFPVRNSRKYLQIGRVYNVYGIFFYNGELMYLIVGHGPPTWEPIVLFEIVDSKLPPEWYFRRTIESVSEDKLNDPLSATWGYKELVDDVYHSDGIMEREAEDMQIFLKRKKEIDEWEKR